MGDTIGAGVFSSLPYAVSLVGPGIAWTWIAAIAMTIFVNIPSVIPSASLPCPSAGYTITSKLLSPYLGFFELISMMNYVIILGLLGIFFADYVNILLPGAPSLAVSLGVIIVFWIINIFGIESGTVVQNIIVVVLLFSLLCFIITGVPSVSSEYLTVSQVLMPREMNFAAFCTCLAVCYNCLGGCFTGCLVLGDRVKNPHRNLILGGCLTALIVGVLYAAISVITCGVVDWTQELPVLGNIAKLFMPRALWAVFIVGGALGAMASTINAMFLSVGYRFDTMAADGIFPAIFNKSCRFGTKPLCIAIAPIAGILLVLLDPPINAMMSACAALAILGGILRFKKVFCILIAFLGMILVSGIINTGLSDISEIKGILLGLGAAVFYTPIVYLNIKNTDVPANDKTIIQLLAATLIMLPYALLTIKREQLLFTYDSILLLLILSIVHTGIAYSLYFDSMKNIDAQSIAILSYIDPVVSILLSVFFLHEAIGITGIIRAVMILGATLINELPGK